LLGLLARARARVPGRAPALERVGGDPRGAALRRGVAVRRGVRRAARGSAQHRVRRRRLGDRGAARRGAVSAEAFWAERLGCPVAAFRKPGLTLVDHPHAAVFVVATARGVAAAAPRALHGALAAQSDPQQLVQWERLLALLPAGATTVGPAWI